ncbi:MAG: hypothetical protein AB2L24_02925 [Mangrovibacterium sp.]
MLIEQILKNNIAKAVSELYAAEIQAETIQIQATRKDVEGDLTVVVFPFLRYSKKSPERTAEDLGHFLEKNVDDISSFEMVKGFLNLTISQKYWVKAIA